MKYGKIMLIAATLVLLATLAVELWAQATQDAPAIAIRQIEPQVVLYKVHRGGFETIGKEIGELYGLAMSKQMIPNGPPSFAYLNNFSRVAKEHWLVEIRIPVGEAALEHAGTLGGMTDVKRMGGTKAAVTTKPRGQADPSPIYPRLYQWAVRKGMVPSEGPSERFLTDVEGADYSDMQTEILLPVEAAADVLAK